MVVKTKTNSEGDLIKWEVFGDFCRLGVTLDHADAGTITIDDPMGYPLVENGDGTATLVIAANEANVNALLIWPTKIVLLTATTLLDIPILRYGPALYNKDILPATDYASAAFVEATLITALKAEHIHDVAEGSKILEQTE